MNLISHQLDIDKTYLDTKGPYKAKYQLLLNKRKGVGLKRCNDSIHCIEYSNDMDDINENNEGVHSK